MQFEAFVLAASTADLNEEPVARAHADCIEFRLDLASDGRKALSAYEGELPLLVTNRVRGEGGDAPDTPDRLDALEWAIDHPRVEAVDLELDSLRKGDAGRIAEHARDENVAVVVSTHDFERTPDSERMRELLLAACEYGDVGKLAVTAHDREDVLALLSVTHELTAGGKRVATMAMGEAGRHSRAVAPLYGSRIGYAPVESEHATAPGQYDLATLRMLVQRLSSDSVDPSQGLDTGK